MHNYKTRHRRLRSKGTLRKIAELIRALKSAESLKNQVKIRFKETHSALSLQIYYDKIRVVVIHPGSTFNLRTKPLRKNDNNRYQPDHRIRSQNLSGNLSSGLSPPC